MKEESNRGYEAGQIRYAARPRTVNVGVLERQIDEELISRRAYALYESRGRADGHADEDWLRAVTEYAAQRAAESMEPHSDYGASRSFGDRLRDHGR
jgi:hypothetical protein